MERKPWKWLLILIDGHKISKTGFVLLKKQNLRIMSLIIRYRENDLIFFQYIDKKDIFYKNSFFFSGKSRLTFFSLTMEYRTFYEEWWRWWLFKKDDGFVLHYLIVPVLDEPSDRNCFAINHFLLFDHRKSKWFVSDYKIKGNRKCRFTPSLWILKKWTFF